MAQCVTGRLATLEEIVDWQPYDHVGWRLTVPGVGPVAAAADLEPVDGGTRLRLRWEYLGTPPDRRRGHGGVSARSGRPHSGASDDLITGGLPVIEERVVTH